MSENAEKTITRLGPNFYQIPQAESWLASMERKGWRLSHAGRFLCSFKKTEPKSCRFRLEPRGKNPPGEEFIDGAAEAGWEYLGDWMETFTIWRSEAENAPEFQTDPVAQSYAFKQLYRNMWMNLIAGGVMTLVVAAIVIYTLLNRPLLAMLDSRENSILIAVLLCIWSDAEAFSNWRSIRKLTKQLKSGSSFCHEAKVKRSLRFPSYLAFLMLTVIFICLPFYSISRQNSFSADNYPGVLPLPRLAELEKNMIEQDEHFVVDGIDYANAAHTSWSLIAPEQVTLSEQGTYLDEAWEKWEAQGSPIDKIPVTLKASYYKLRPGWLAGPMLSELCEKWSEDFGAEFSPLPAGDGTKAFFARKEEMQFLLLQRRNEIVAVRYAGLEELADRMDITLRKLDAAAKETP